MRGVRWTVLFLCLLGAVPLAAAQSFEVGVSSDDPRVWPEADETAVFNVSITNRGEADDVFQVGYRVSHPGWYFMPRTVVAVPEDGTRYVPLYVSPDANAVEGNYGIRIRVRRDGQMVERQAVVQVVRNRTLIVTDLTTDRVSYRPGDRVNVSVTVKNVRDHELAANAYRAVLDLGDVQEAVSVPGLGPSGTATLTASLPLGQYDAGVKTLAATVESLDGRQQERRTAQVRVEQVERVVEERDSSFQLLARSTSVTVRNRGNVESDGTTVSGSVPAYMSMFVSFSREPTASSTAAGSAVYEWQLGQLAPGQRVTVSYQVHYWVPAAIIVALLLLAGYGVWQYRQPTIVKRVYQRDGNHSVHLRVENRSGRVLDGVTVTDTVPSIASLIEKFDATPPERIRKGGETTEMEWNLGRLEPGEERILTYQLSAQVAVEGAVTLPGARMQYRRGESTGKTESGTADARFG